jgi:hypothetical protein
MISENRNEDLPNNKDSTHLQKLLNIIYNEPNYYPGSFHKNSDLKELVNIAHQVLFSENNSSIAIIIDRNKNNSIDITIDTIK